MVSLATLRHVAGYLQETYRVSERRSCRVIGLNRATKRNVPKQSRDQQLRERVHYLSEKYPRFGYRKIYDKLKALREQAQLVVSLVAEDEDDGTIVGHIMFSPVSLTGYPELRIMGLAPMAVAPERQGKGIGSALVRAGLEQCKQLGFGAVVVLGYPEYYPRFGFTPSTRFGIVCEYEVPEDAFMLLELYPGYLRGASGKVEYHAAFKNV